MINLEIKQEGDKLSKESLERERKGTTRDIQMWLMLHPEDYEYISYLIGKLSEVNEKLSKLD